MHCDMRVRDGLGDDYACATGLRKAALLSRVPIQSIIAFAIHISARGVSCVEFVLSRVVCTSILHRAPALDPGV